MNLPRPFNSQAGFSLIEIAIVLGILALLLTLFTGMSTNLISQHRRELTRTRLANIDMALTLFVSQYKRLPCPADGKLVSSDPSAGKENPLPAPPASQPANCTPASTNNQKDGVVPWVALGLTASDIEDGWGGRFTYRVGPDLVMNNAMDFSSCDPAGGNPANAVPPPPVLPPPPPNCYPVGLPATGCNAGNLPIAFQYCTSPNIALTGAPGKGLVVEDVAGNVIMDPCLNRATSPPALVSTGAAYMLISHGADGGGAYNGLGIKQDSNTVAGTMEEKNFPYHQYLPSGACPATSFLVDDVYNGGYNAGAGVPDPTYHFDDMVSRPNILTVATRAQLGPRSH
jgi:prepilin-type N-terminal cleavage/methylation domain-containing protein